MGGRILISVALAGILSLGAFSCAEKKKGCTDPRAQNFDVQADLDDGSCIPFEDLLEGDFVYLTNKSSAGTYSVIVTDSFHIRRISDNVYKMTGLLGCNEIIVRLQGIQFVLESSDCDISAWESSIVIDSYSMLLLTKKEGGEDYFYSGQFSRP